MTLLDWDVTHDPPGTNQFERWSGLTFARAIDLYDAFVVQGSENVRMAFTNRLLGERVPVDLEAFRAGNDESPDP
jgi:hypothetical protein